MSPTKKILGLTKEGIHDFKRQKYILFDIFWGFKHQYGLAT